jgi:ribosomal protein S18 acetylase RimI-like enzyme
MDNIREMNLNDVPSVVNVHLESFMGFFLSSLGARFLCELYESILMDQTHIAFVCAKEGKVLGFVAGTTHPVGFYGRALKRNWRGFVIASILPILKNPMMAIRLLRRLIAQRETLFDNGYALLMSVAVNPNRQGNGIGRQLVSEFLEEANSRGCAIVTLTTDALENDSVNRFYRSMKFQLSKEYITTEGRRMNEYVYTLNGNHGAWYGNLK